MLRGIRSTRTRRSTVGVWLVSLLATGIVAGEGWDPAVAVVQAMSAAESSLQSNELATATRHYRNALLQGWLLMGTLERLEERLPEAREAYHKALPFAGEDRPALQSLAFQQLRAGEAAEAAAILSGLAEKDPADAEPLRLLAMALAAAGHVEQAMQKLDEAAATAPDDPQQVFLLATGYLWLKRVDAAERLFAQVIEARPIPQTRVLVGRAYRDAGEYERARAELEAALRQDPSVRRAHYYLGMAILANRATDPDQMEKAAAEFREELKLEPDDALTNDQLGVVLLDFGRPAEALPFLEKAARGDARSRYLLHLGRCQLALDRLAEGATSTRRALELARDEGAGAAELERVHYQLGRALRMLGEEEAKAHFAAAGRLQARQRDTASDETREPRSEGAARWPFSEASPLAALTPPQRLELRRRVSAALARAYFNLGVLQAQRESGSVADRFASAAALFESAAEVDPDFPQVYSSLGVAYFNARRFDEAAEPLARALAADPANPGLRRMLALASINTQTWARAVVLLRDDPELESDPSLQSAYALALVGSGRGAEAEKVLAALLSRQGDSAELRALLGQAYAQQEKYGPAIEALERALQLQADVAEAHRTLGVVYLRLGRLEEAERALRSELEAIPSDTRAQLHLAAVLGAQNRLDEALALVRAVLEAQPQSAEALYLLGSMLLARGEAAEALEHLEAAARLIPEDANVRHQLGQAYQSLGRTELARQELEASRRLRDNQQ